MSEGKVVLRVPLIRCAAGFVVHRFLKCEKCGAEAHERCKMNRRIN